MKYTVERMKKDLILYETGNKKRYTNCQGCIKKQKEIEYIKDEG